MPIREAGALGSQPTNGAGLTVFGLPIGGLGFFASLLMGVFTGVFSFFLILFFSIAGIMIWNGAGHRMNYADSYLFLAFPAGCAMAAAGILFFVALWAKRKFSGN